MASTKNRKNAFYAQSGGVTAVINASACGVIETARASKDRIGKVYAGRNGIIGALTEELIDTGAESVEAIAALRIGSASFIQRSSARARRAATCGLIGSISITRSDQNT